MDDGQQPQRSPLQPATVSSQIPQSSSPGDQPLSSWDLPFEFTNTQRQLVSGGVAGCVAKTLTAPLSRLTILFQVHSMVTTKPHAPAFSEGMVSGLRKIVGKEGFLAFWKGNMTSVVHRFPYSAINFHAYETVMRFLEESQSGQPAALSTSALRFLAGATAGGIATASCYPLDLVRTRLTTQLGQPNSTELYYRGIGHCLYRIGVDEGLLGLYKGLGVTLLVQIPNLAISYSMYGFLRDKALQRLGLVEVQSLGNNVTGGGNDASKSTNCSTGSSQSNKRAPIEASSKGGKTKVTLVNMASGALSGVASTLVIYPLDVLRRRMQLQGLHRSQPGQKKGALNEVLTILRVEGFAGMYRGLTPELCKIVPMVGCTFCVYEAMRDLLQVEK